MFRTELTIAPQERQLPRTARVLTVGSCFAESIGERLRLNKVQTLVNPFGTVFQPLALAQLLRAAAGEEQDWQQHLVEARGRWQSYDFHSTIGAESPVELLQIIQETVRRVGDFVRTADAVVLTLGTAWAYRLRETDELVSNLHKLPASLFEKELLTADEIVNGLAEVHALLRRINPKVHIILTVSPVRHLKETLPLNAVSKSVLRVACHYLSELLPGVSYFPAYELLTDDLRDYRFYAADMLHPSEAAEEYIWDRFTRGYFDAEFGRFRKEWAAVRQALGHRPLHAGAPEHRTFLDQTYERLTRLASQGVDVRQELRDVQRQLAALPPPKLVRVAEVAPDDDEERIDIGEGTATTDVAVPTTERSENRYDRRRNNRHGERAGRDRGTTEDAPPAAIQEERAIGPEIAEAVVVDEGLAAPDTEASDEESDAYPAKKKKRRSRGGAKRTARKNAARLATDQQASQPALDAVPEEAAELVADESLPMDTDEEANTDLADDTSGLAPTEASEEFAPAEEVVEPAAVPAVPAANRKRGTGPTPKKSKVITKSGLVQRGKRGSLYRSPAPVSDEAVSTPLPAEPATAPIISPPIIPEVLLERPAVALATLPSEAAPELATPLAPTQEQHIAPARRGRPKATRPTGASQPSQPPEATATETATTVPDEPAETPATPDGAPTPKAKKPKAASSKTTKKAAAQPAASRRGRPPGKKTPPPAAETSVA
jgi:hypothetical protein